MNISGHTTPYAVLGHPIGHTLSPIMHNAALAELGLDAIYLAFDVHPDRLLEVLPAMREMGFGGVNLTVPLKETAFRGLENMSDEARGLGAVNTIEFLPDGSIKGHNTDGYGFLTALDEAFDIRLEGKSVFVLGTGGAGRAVAITCAGEGAAEIRLADLDAERTSRVAAEIGALHPSVTVRAAEGEIADWAAPCRASDIVVQATPVGMKPDDPSPIAVEAFRDGQHVIDLVYMYPQTGFMRAAEAQGARGTNGLGMLLHQGARSFTIWTGQDAAVSAMRRALEESVYGKDS